MSLVSSSHSQRPLATDATQRPLAAEVALRRLQHRAAQLLTSTERRRLRAIVAAFRRHHQVAVFADALLALLDTPAKRHLLSDLRNFVPAAQRRDYARFVQHKDVAGLSDGANCQTVVTLTKDEDEALGFSIRGGSEHGLGIFVSELDETSAAALAGLRLGDNIVEVNSVSFDKIASSSAVKVLVGSNRLRIIVRHTGLVPGFRASREQTAWYDVVHQRTVRHVDPPIGSPAMNRRINLTSHRHGHYRGFNIRGGREYGLGIYVSSVDAGGAAEQKGLKSGDEILDVNGVNLDQMTHAEVVSLMKNEKQLILTVKDVGRYPVFKEVYAEYKWVDAVTGIEMKTRTSGEITSVPVLAEPTGVTNLSFGSPCWPSDESQPDDDTADDRLFSSSDSLALFSQPVVAPPGGVQTNYDDRESGSEHDSGSLSEQGSEVKINEADVTPHDHQGDWTMLGARAMELETRRDHPELWKEFQENGGSTPAVKKVNRSRTFRELIFGTKSRAGGGKKNATEGARSAKPWKRKPLSSIDFRKPQTDGSGIEETTFSHGMGSQLMLQKTMRQDTQLATVDKKAEKLLNADEVAAVHRHIKGYKETGNMGALLAPLLAILDSSEKRALLEEIRTVIAPKDIRRFDAIVAEQNRDVTDKIPNQIVAKATIESEPAMSPRQPDEDSGVDMCPLTTRRRLSSQHFGSLEYWDEVISPTVVHQAPADARHDLEIHRFRSNSKVYRAAQFHQQEMEDEDQVAKQYGDDDSVANGRRDIDGGDDGEQGDISGLAWIIAELGAEMGANEEEEEEDENKDRASEADERRKSSDDEDLDVDSQEGKWPLGDEELDSLKSSNKTDCESTGVELTLARLRDEYTNEHELPAGDITLQRLNRRHVTHRYYDDYEDDDDDDDNDGFINGLSNAVCSDDETSTADGSATCGDISEATASLDFLDNLDGADDDDDENNDQEDDAEDGTHASANIDTSGLPEGATISLSPTTVTENVGSKTPRDTQRFPDSPISYKSRGYFDFPTHSGDSPSCHESHRKHKSPENHGSLIYRQSPEHRATVNKSHGSPKYRSSPSPSRKLSYQLPNGHADELDIDNRSRRKAISVLLDKRCRSLGLSISGGRDSHNQPDVKVQQVLPGGAAHEEGTIQSGMRLLSIDDQRLESATHAEAVDVIRRAYMDKTTRYMKISVMEDGD